MELLSLKVNWLVLFSLILGGEKTILMILSLVFALLTRNIHLKEFETKNTVILVSMMTIGIPLYLIVTIQSVQNKTTPPIKVLLG